MLRILTLPLKRYSEEFPQLYLKTDIGKSCRKIMVSDIFWHILLTISFRIGIVGIGFAADKFRAKLDASANPIDLSTNVVKIDASADAAKVNAFIAVPWTNDEVRQFRINSDALGMLNLPPSEANMMTYSSAKANDLTNLGLAAKRNEYDSAATAKSPATIGINAIPDSLKANIVRSFPSNAIVNAMTLSSSLLGGFFVIA